MIGIAMVCCLPSCLPIEGGPNSRVVGYYDFDTFSDFSNFYRIFKEHNVERYWVPADSKEIAISYCFKSEGVRYRDVQASRYDLTFGLQSMFATINGSGFSFKAQLAPLSVADEGLLFNDLFSVEVEPKKSNLTKTGLTFLCGDIEIGRGSFKEDPEDEISLKRNVDHIASLFQGGLGFVF
ncbi:MAG: hypothetical protein ACI32C_01300 [Candidatus Enteromonas sp.]